MARSWPPGRNREKRRRIEPVAQAAILVCYAECRGIFSSLLGNWIMKKRVTVLVDAGVLDEAKNCVFYLSGPPHRMTLSSLVERAIDDTVISIANEIGLEADEFPQRNGELRRGPVRARTMEHPDAGVVGTYGAARRLGVSTSTIGKMVRSGQLPHARIGRLLKFSTTDLDRFIADNTSTVWTPQT